MRDSIHHGPWIPVTCGLPDCDVKGGVTIALKGNINVDAHIDLDLDRIWCTEHVPKHLRKQARLVADDGG